MAQFDVSLNNLIFPGVSDLEIQGVGSKLADGESLIAKQASINDWLPFFSQRALSVTEDSSTGVVARNCSFAIEGAGLDLTLGNAEAAGIKVEIQGAFISNDSSTVTFTTDSGTFVKDIYSGDLLTLVSVSSGKWIIQSSLEDGEFASLESESVHHAYGMHRWLQFDFTDVATSGATHRKSVRIKAGTRIRLDIDGASPRWLRAKTDKTFDLSKSLAALSRAWTSGPWSGASPVGVSSYYKDSTSVFGQTVYLYLVPKVTYTYDDEAQGITSVAIADGSDVTIIPSLNSTAPTDMLCPGYGTADVASGHSVNSPYTGDNTRKIGWFHTLCGKVASTEATNTENRVPLVKMPTRSNPSQLLLVPYSESEEEKAFHDFYLQDVQQTGTVNTQYETLTMYNHPLKDFIAGDILPESVFCLSFRPSSSKVTEFVYDKRTNTPVTIYPQSIGCTSEQTAYKFLAAQTSAGTSNTAVIQTSRIYSCMENDALQVGCHFLDDYQFTSAALGSNEKTNVLNSNQSTALSKSGGHIDTNKRRHISIIGCEAMCGVIWVPLKVYGPVGGSSWGTYDGTANWGQTYGTPYQLLAGGDWGNGASCGSRCRNSITPRSDSNVVSGSRACCELVLDAA